LGQRIICKIPTPALDSEPSLFAQGREASQNGDFDFIAVDERFQQQGVGKRLILASTLSLIHPQDLLLNVDRGLWFEIASKTFQSGQYSPENESNAHALLTGATVKDSYLVLSGKYQLNILGMLPRTLPQEIERSLTE
jgi:hypothetical protein